MAERKSQEVDMKMRIALALVITIGSLGSLTARADDLFQMFWRINVYQKNSTGHIIAYRMSEQDFVNTIAHNNGLNPADLVFVYRPNKHDTAVVRRSNGAFVADVIQMEYNYFDMVNPTGAIIVRHALLYDENHQTPLGSFFGTEYRSLTSGGALANDSLVGTVMYTKPDEGRIFVGQVSTGQRIVDTSGAP